jgi:indolepyruvate ferredoxin oxidoreductase alpha subunit
MAGRRRLVLKEISISSDAPGKRLLLLGNEAMARGAIEAGVQVAASYPGTPSSEIMGTLTTVAHDVGMYVEWSTNEKVAFEVSYGGSLSGARAMSSMKQAGLSVALDSVKAASWVGVRGGLVLIACDEPTEHLKQGLRDSRYIAEREYMPILEPSSVQEAKEMMVDAFRLSEEFGLAFMLRSVTSLSHARSDVVLGEISKEKRPGSFVRDRTPLGLARGEFPVFSRFRKIREAVDKFPYNQLKLVKGAKLGVIAPGISYGFALEAIRDLGLADKVSILKIGTPHPLPEGLVKKLLSSVEEVLVLEELSPFVELHVKAVAGEANIPLKIHGKDLTSPWELSPKMVTQAIANLTGAKPSVDYAALEKLSAEIAELIPVRPPYACAGCPHRATQYAMKVAAERVAKDYGIDIDPIYPGDIGCYSLGSNPPLSVWDASTATSMGGSVGVASGLAHRVKAPIVCQIGDSTFFHAAMPGLVNAVMSDVNITVIIMDNGATAMTGFQPHPGVGRNAMGEETYAVKPEEVVKAFGIKFVEVVDPFENLEQAADVIERAIRFEGPAVVISRRLCSQEYQRELTRRGEQIVPYFVDQEKCSKAASGAADQRQFPCEAACLAGNDIDRFLGLAKLGKFDEAAALLRQTNPLPAVLGRVCNHPCELDCNRGRFDEAIATQMIERFLGDHGLSLPVTAPREKRKERVAVVGSGPAGLSCAYHLALMGYGVTVFEASPQPGGMMRMGIPEYRLPRNILDAEIERIRGFGVEIKTDSRVDSMDDLLNDGYKAAFVAVGAHRASRIDIEGGDLPGVVDGLSFLKGVNLGEKAAIGKRVAVIGGGNVAIDAARIAVRLGAEQVRVICLESKHEMPAFECDIRRAIEEGVSIEAAWGPRRIIGDGEKVTGLELVRCTSVLDKDGNFKPCFDESETRMVDADNVIMAIGQAPELPEGFGLSAGGSKTIQVEAESMATNKEGIFAGGDAVTGTATVAGAVGAGWKAAVSIDRFIRKVPAASTGKKPEVIRFEDLNLAFTLPAPRGKSEALPVAERVKGFAEVESGFTAEKAIAESRRCLACSSGSEVCITQFGCPAVIREDGRTVVDYLQCAGCGVCAQVCRYRAMSQELVP